MRATRYQVNMSLFLIWSVADTGLAQYTQLTCVPLPEFDIYIVYIFDLLQPVEWDSFYLLCGTAEAYQLLATLVTNLMVVIRWSLQHSNSTEI